MDAIQFLKIVGRICKANDGKCDECPLDKYPCSADINRTSDAEPDSGIEEMVNIADRWAKDHPFNTRQSQLLKMFPDARTDDAGILVCCPDAFIAKEISAEYCNKYNKCQECRKDYWLAEVDT